MFPITALFKFVAIEIFGKLLKSPRGNDFMLVITDQWSKLIHTVPLKNVTAATVAKAVVTH